MNTIDYKIATEVLGLPKPPFAPPQAIRLNAWMWLDSDWCPLCFSTDLDSAMWAVERVLASGKYESFSMEWTHEDSIIEPNEYRWCVVLIPFELGADWIVEWSDSLPMAICLALLQTAEDKDDSQSTDQTNH